MSLGLSTSYFIVVYSNLFMYEYQRNRRMQCFILSFFQLGEVNPLISPRTMESMDIYEELIREEQEEKQATYNEVCKLN